MQEVHLWHSGHVDLHVLVSAFLSEIFNRPLLQAGPEIDASQHGRSALEKFKIIGIISGETSLIFQYAQTDG